ncbi:MULTISPECIES: hypothetical protein, partial [unclassified Rhodococcus (in: high G+C Gram-positive bacteria)]|uniref:hypothetical protein n=1 Tax=unclassified Rhodococcus (in: high G+C Gram-positive bacteria) TaxID=192944 RepID=UPI001C9B201D
FVWVVVVCACSLRTQQCVDECQCQYFVLVCWFFSFFPSGRDRFFFVSNGVIAGVSFIAGFGSLVFIGSWFLAGG